MTTFVDILVLVAGAIGLADIIRIIIEKLFTKRRDEIANAKDEFSVLRDRIEYAEKEVSRLSRQQVTNKKLISRLYAFVADMTKQTCSKKNCKMRDLIAVDFASIEDGLDDIDNEYGNEPEMPDGAECGQ